MEKGKNKRENKRRKNSWRFLSPVLDFKKKSPTKFHLRGDWTLPRSNHPSSQVQQCMRACFLHLSIHIFHILHMVDCSIYEVYMHTYAFSTLPLFPLMYMCIYKNAYLSVYIHMPKGKNSICLSFSTEPNKRLELSLKVQNNKQRLFPNQCESTFVLHMFRFLFLLCISLIVEGQETHFMHVDFGA